MPKDARDAKSSEISPIRPNGDPPPLSEKLIEEFCNAVNKARQKRVSGSAREAARSSRRSESSTRR